MSDKVYLIGEWGDPPTMAFSDRETAERALSLLQNPCAEITEFPVDLWSEQIRSGLVPVTVYMKMDGNVRVATAKGALASLVRDGRACTRRVADGSTEVQATVWASDVADGIRIVGTIRRRALAGESLTEDLVLACEESVNGRPLP